MASVTLSNAVRRHDAHAHHAAGWWRGRVVRHAAVGLALGAAFGAIDFLRVLPLTLDRPEISPWSKVLETTGSWAFSGMFVGILLALLERTHVRGWKRAAFVCVVLVVGSALVALSATYLFAKVNEDIDIGLFASRLSGFLYNYWLVIACGGLGLLLQVSARRAQEATQRLRAAEMDRQTTQKNVVESKLTAMQARVEPLFLFDALERARHAYLRDPDDAEQQLDHLISYLRAALPQLREGSSTLRREALLIEAYLRVLDGNRATLSFEDATPVELRPVELPPMLLLPLVEAALEQIPLDASPNHHLVFGAAVSGSRLEISLSIDKVVPGLALAAALELTQDTLRALYSGAADADVARPTLSTVQIKLWVPHEL